MEEKNNVKKFSKEFYEQRANKFQELFYKYTGIKPGTVITEEDIKYYSNAFNRISLYEGCTTVELTKALLNKKDV